MDSPVIPFDMQRIFFGDYTPLYFAEVAFRIAVIYAYTLLMIRWIGARGVAQLSMVELLLVIALGSAVGDALFYDDVPLLVAMWVITLVVVINKVLDKLIVRSERIGRAIDGRPLEVVRDGVLVCGGLADRDLGPGEVKAMLRREGVANLGEVARAYVEINGGLSVFRNRPARPGLAIVPPREIAPPTPLTDIAPGASACCTGCGHVTSAAEVVPDGACPNCDEHTWTAPTTEEKSDAE